MVNTNYLINIIKYNIKIIFNINILTAVAMVLISPLLFNYEQLNYGDIAIIGEMYLVLLGILLIPHLTNIESIVGISSITTSKAFKQSTIYVFRICINIIVILALVLVTTTFAVVQKSTFPLIEIWLGISISALYFGLVGLTITNIFSNTIAGYLVAFSYYMFELFTKGKFTGNLYALSLLKTSFAEKYYLLAICVVLLCINYFIVKKRN